MMFQLMVINHKTTVHRNIFCYQLKLSRSAHLEPFTMKFSHTLTQSKHEKWDHSLLHPECDLFKIEFSGGRAAYVWEQCGVVSSWWCTNNFFSWINANLNSFKCLLVNVSMDFVKHNRARANLKLDFVKTFVRFLSNEKQLKDVKKWEESQLVHSGRSKANFAFLFVCDDINRQTVKRIRASTDDRYHRKRFRWTFRHSLSYPPSHFAIGNVARLVNYSFMQLERDNFHHQKEFLPSRSISSRRLEQKRASESFHLNQQTNKQTNNETLLLDQQERFEAWAKAWVIPLINPTARWELREFLINWWNIFFVLSVLLSRTNCFLHVFISWMINFSCRLTRLCSRVMRCSCLDTVSTSH